MVMLLFGLEGRILVIDQPDDYLQDPSLQAEIVQILREQKSSGNQEGGRQVILAAKDAALPVMADAELVLPLEIRDDRASIVGEASIDDRSIREAIRSMMQGGKKLSGSALKNMEGSPYREPFEIAIGARVRDGRNRAMNRDAAPSSNFI